MNECEHRLLFVNGFFTCNKCGYIDDEEMNIINDGTPKSSNETIQKKYVTSNAKMRKKYNRLMYIDRLNKLISRTPLSKDMIQKKYILQLTRIMNTYNIENKIRNLMIDNIYIDYIHLIKNKDFIDEINKRNIKTMYIIQSLVYLYTKQYTFNIRNFIKIINADYKQQKFYKEMILVSAIQIINKYKKYDNNNVETELRNNIKTRTYNTITELLPKYTNLIPDINEIIDNIEYKKLINKRITTIVIVLIKYTVNQVKMRNDVTKILASAFNSTLSNINLTYRNNLNKIITI